MQQQTQKAIKTRTKADMKNTAQEILQTLPPLEERKAELKDDGKWHCEHCGHTSDQKQVMQNPPSDTCTGHFKLETKKPANGDTGDKCVKELLKEMKQHSDMEIEQLKQTKKRRREEEESIANERDGPKTLCAGCGKTMGRTTLEKHMHTCPGKERLAKEYYALWYGNATDVLLDPNTADKLIPTTSVVKDEKTGRTLFTIHELHSNDAAVEQQLKTLQGGFGRDALANELMLVLLGALTENGDNEFVNEHSQACKLNLLMNFFDQLLRDDDSGIGHAAPSTYDHIKGVWITFNRKKGFLETYMERLPILEQMIIDNLHILINFSRAEFKTLVYGMGRFRKTTEWGKWLKTNEMKTVSDWKDVNGERVWVDECVDDVDENSRKRDILVRMRQHLAHYKKKHSPEYYDQTNSQKKRRAFRSGVLDAHRRVNQLKRTEEKEGKRGKGEKDGKEEREEKGEEEHKQLQWRREREKEDQKENEMLPPLHPIREEEREEHKEEQEPDEKEPDEQEPERKDEKQQDFTMPSRPKRPRPAVTTVPDPNACKICNQVYGAEGRKCVGCNNGVHRYCMQKCAGCQSMFCRECIKKDSGKCQTCH